MELCAHTCSCTQHTTRTRAVSFYPRPPPESQPPAPCRLGMAGSAPPPASAAAPQQCLGEQAKGVLQRCDCKVQVRRYPRAINRPSRNFAVPHPLPPCDCNRKAGDQNSTPRSAIACAALNPSLNQFFLQPSNSPGASGSCDTKAGDQTSASRSAICCVARMNSANSADSLGWGPAPSTRRCSSAVCIIYAVV